MTNQVANQNKEFETRLAKVNNTYLPMITRQLEGNSIVMDGYSKQCVIAAISAINAVLDDKQIDWTSPNLDQSNLTQTLLNVAAMKLNAAANPREVYFQIRSVKRGEKWLKQIEMGIEGDGNDAILSRFGRNVKEVKQFWLVREEDVFEYPSYNGLELTPPKWTPKGKGDVIRVVYPVIKADNSIEFYIGEREDVAKNLVAHIKNNLMNETFGLAEDRYKATADQKKQIQLKKDEVLKKAYELGLKALDDPEIQKYISPAWKDVQSRESMIIRKIRNNIVKKIPKDFGAAFLSMTYDEATDPEYKRVRKEVNENANQEILDFDNPVPTPESNDEENNIIEHPAMNVEKEEPKAEKIKHQEQKVESTGTKGPAW